MTNHVITATAVAAAMDALYHAQDCDVTAEDVLVRAALEAAAPHMLALAWDEAIQRADDEGCLLYHQVKGLKSLNPYRSQP